MVMGEEEEERCSNKKRDNVVRKRSLSSLSRKEGGAI
jgi:hypothetical protein